MEGEFKIPTWVMLKKNDVYGELGTKLVGMTKTEFPGIRQLHIFLLCFDK